MKHCSRSFVSLAKTASDSVVEHGKYSGDGVGGGDKATIISDILSGLDVYTGPARFYTKVLRKVGEWIRARAR